MRWAALFMLCCGCHAEHERIYVSAEADGSVFVVDPVAARVTSRIGVGKRPRGLKLSRDGKLLFVAQSGSARGGPNVDESKLPPADRAADGVSVVDLRAGKLVRTLPGGQDPESFDLSADGEALYVSNEETAELSVVSIGAARVTRRISVGRQPEGVTMHPSGKLVYVTSEEDDLVVVIDVQRGTEVARIVTGKRPRTIVFSPDGALAFVSNELGASVSIIDTKQQRVQQQLAITVPNGPEPRPMGLALSADGRLLYVSTGRAGAVAVIDVAKRSQVKVFRDLGTRPWGIALSRDEKYLYTANGPSDDITLLELATGKQRRLKLGGLPWGLVVGTQ